MRVSLDRVARSYWPVGGIVKFGRLIYSEICARFRRDGAPLAITAVLK
jgi:hypothetical protein